MRIHSFEKILAYPLCLYFCCASFAMGYSCNDFWCSDYKAGVGGYVATHNASTIESTQGGAYLVAHFRRWKERFSFGVEADFGAGGASIKSSTQSPIPNLEKYSTNFNFSATLHTGINAYELQTPIFIDFFTTFKANFYEVESKLPNTILLSLGASLSSMQNLNDILGLECGIAYGYIVYGSHTFREFSPNRPNPQFPTNNHKTNDTTSRIGQNSHELKTFIGLFANRGVLSRSVGVYGRLSAIYHYIDSSRQVVFNNANNVYCPHTQNLNIMFEIGVGF